MDPGSVWSRRPTPRPDLPAAPLQSSHPPTRQRQTNANATPQCSVKGAGDTSSQPASRRRHRSRDLTPRAGQSPHTHRLTASPEPRSHTQGWTISTHPPAYSVTGAEISHPGPDNHHTPTGLQCHRSRDLTPRARQSPHTHRLTASPEPRSHTQGWTITTHPPAYGAEISHPGLDNHHTPTGLQRYRSRDLTPRTGQSADACASMSYHRHRSYHGHWAGQVSCTLRGRYVKSPDDDWQYNHGSTTPGRTADSGQPHPSVCPSVYPSVHPARPKRRPTRRDG